MDKSTNDLVDSRRYTPKSFLLNPQLPKTMLTPNQKMQNGRYTVISAFNQKDTIESYKAFDNELQTSVLIKGYPIHFQDEFSNNLAQEADDNLYNKKAETLSRIKHNSLLQINHYFSENENNYLVFEHYNGESLKSLVERTKQPIPFAEIIKLADQLLESIGFLHSQTPPIIHKEIKPENLILNSDKSIKLSTLNIINHADLGKNFASKDEHFESKNLIYSPLEQLWQGLDSASKNVILNNFDENSQKILEQPIDARSDIYSFGATLYFLSTAKPPVDSISRLIDMLDGNADPLLSPHQINSEIPEEFSDVIMKALEIKRENRFNASVIMRQVLRTAIVRIEEKENQDETETPVIPQPKVAKKVQNPKPEIKKITNPPISAKVDDSGPNKKVADAPNQLELIKQQLQEAEKRRIEAEQRALEAEKLLQKQEALKALNVPSVEEKTLDENDTEIKQTQPESKPELIQNPNKQSAKDPEPEKIVSVPKNPELENISSVAENIEPEKIESIPEHFEPKKVESVEENIESEKVENVEDSADYFADLYEEPQKPNKSFGKFAVSAALLLLVGAMMLGVWHFFGDNLFRENQVVTKDKNESPAKSAEETQVQEPTVSENTVLADDPETQETLDSENSQENNDSAENSLSGENDSDESDVNVSDTQNDLATKSASAPSRQNKKPNTRLPRKPRQIKRQQPKPKVATENQPKPKPSKAPKKTVTLDDLIKDN